MQRSAARRTTRVGPGAGVCAAALVVALSSAACMPTSAAYPEMEIDPIVVGGPGSARLAPANFMAGCWRGRTPDGVGIQEERWSPPAAGLMLGSSRSFAGSRLGSFEHLTIQGREDGDVVLLPSPGGRPSEAVFTLSETGRNRVLFEAPDHDYPRRIEYALVGERLHVRVDGGADDDAPLRWQLDRVACAS